MFSPSLTVLIMNNEVTPLNPTNRVERLWDIPGEGEVVQLVEVGTHCRGAIFLDGAWPETESLAGDIDRISKSYTGFYFGRFDIRTPFIQDFRQAEILRLLS